MDARIAQTLDLTGDLYEDKLDLYASDVWSVGQTYILPNLGSNVGIELE